MGYYRWNKKGLVEECRCVSIAYLNQNHYLDDFRTGQLVWKNCFGEETSSVGFLVSILKGEPYIRFLYTSRNTGEKTEYDYKVGLTTTPCHFGGVRYWFICPLTKDGVYCGRRVAKLYKAPGSNYFGCRHCYNLSYESRNETRSGRFAEMGHFLLKHQQYKEMLPTVKRRMYQGKPTKKFRRLLTLEHQLLQEMTSLERQELILK
ncbi:MAG: hypothetical protein JW902_09720 [Syntrophaceae bacterium]|nr:hypothetical protein [Syntrophaceae bacterium]